MKLFHLGDLHFGKSIYGLSMLDDQKYWVGKFIEKCSSDRPDAIMIAGDVYDRAAPRDEAVALLDSMLTDISDLGIPVFLIAGNHDSGQKISFGKKMLGKQNIYISGIARKEIDHITLPDPDGFGDITFWMLPYTFPEQISNLLGDDSIRTYNDAVRKLISVQDIDLSRRNIIISHQNVVCEGKEAERGGSETMVGGVGQIDYHVYDPFDYVALGHIHSSYSVGREEVRYPGTPMCYHFNETRQKDKGFIEVVIREKGTPLKIRDIAIEPLHRMRYFVGKKEEIYSLIRSDKGMNEYVGIKITDERNSPETSSYIRGILKERGSVLLEIMSSYYAMQNRSLDSSKRPSVEEKSLEELFEEFYLDQYDDNPPNDGEYELMRFAADLIRTRKNDIELTEKEFESVVTFARSLNVKE